MGIHRLYRLAERRAFTLAETVISLVLVAAAALLLLTSITVSSNFMTRAAELREEADRAVSSLYRGEAEIISQLSPQVRLEAASPRYENIEGIPAVDVGYAEVTESICLYYYGGGSLDETD